MEDRGSITNLFSILDRQSSAFSLSVSLTVGKPSAIGSKSLTKSDAQEKRY